MDEVQREVLTTRVPVCILSTDVSEDMDREGGHYPTKTLRAGTVTASSMPIVSASSKSQRTGHLMTILSWIETLRDRATRYSILTGWKGIQAKPKPRAL